MTSPRGKFITVEGIEGTGKSTQFDFLTDQIEQRGHTVFRTREPGGTPMAERVRRILLDIDQEPIPEIAELLLFFASRSLHLQNAIVPALARGEWVLCDRFTDTSRAYQGSGRGLDMAQIETLADWVQGDIEPDLTILLDAPAEIGLERAKMRGDADRMDSQVLEFYRRARQGYLALAERFSERFEVVDASVDIAAVQVSIQRILQNKLFSNLD
ncbi:MAG: dTMP kinase [Woeseiaceae bacterium]|jgi:dTMP kinase|nr:dTMP kinase [Woeseiaceae bacterium]